MWVTDWWDGPVEGMASYQGRDCWFRAIFDAEADEWTSPRRCRLFELTPDERDRLWSWHRLREQHAGGSTASTPARPALPSSPAAEAFHAAGDHPARTGRLIGEFTAPLHAPTRRDIPA